MKVALWSPLPPARTGVADYSVALLRALRAHGNVAVGASRADAHLYHLGNNQLHRDIYEQALRQPGVVVLHDAVLHHFFLGSLTEAEYVREFAFNYGDWAADQARALWRTRSRSATDPRYFRYPMLRRIAERSRAVIVHNPAAAAMVRQHVPEANVLQIPHLFEALGVPDYESERARVKLGVPRSTLLCGVFGHLRESKRLLPILRSVATARRDAPIALLVAGEFASRDLARSAGSLLCGDYIRRVGYSPGREFWTLAKAVDTCINLRYPAAGETSGIAIGVMGLGGTIIISGGVESTSFPTTACVRVDPGEAEEEMLAAYLIWLARNPEIRAAIGRAAQEFIRQEHSPQRVAAMYWDVLNRCR